MLAAQDQRTRPAVMVGGFYVAWVTYHTWTQCTQPTPRALHLVSYPGVSSDGQLCDCRPSGSEGGGEGRGGRARKGGGRERGEGRGGRGGKGRGGKGGEGCLFSSPHNSQHVEAVNSVCTHSPQDGEE